MHKLIRALLKASCLCLFSGLLFSGAGFRAYGQGNVIFVPEPGFASAQRVTVVDNRMTGGPLPTENCVAPEPKSGFAPSDARAYQWLRLSGINTGDLIEWNFLRPDGVLFATFQFPFTNSGAGCIAAYIDISGQPPAFLSGAWQVRVFYTRAFNNIERIVTDHFTISGPNLATNVSAASYKSPAAPLAVMALYGDSLTSTTTTVTTLPLPTVLAGVLVRVRDSEDVERTASLFFVSPTQVNYLVPAETKDGTAVVTVTRSIGTITTGLLPVTKVAPALFTANATGQGIAAALVLRVKADGTQLYEPVASFDASQNRYIAQPIDLGPSTDQVFLVLFGTGFRERTALTAVTCRIGEIDAEVTFAGAQNGFVGLDQVNVRLPRTLAGRGEVDVVFRADDKAANTVRVQIR
jgi:uncharacterized protein (TIGR03437 family)